MEHMGTSFMIEEEVRHLEMPDKCVVKVVVTIGFTTKLVWTRKHFYIKKNLGVCVYYVYMCVIYLCVIYVCVIYICLYVYVYRSVYIYIHIRVPTHTYI